MALWLVVLVAALIAFLIGFGTAATWLVVVAVVLLAAGLLGLPLRRGGSLEREER